MMDGLAARRAAAHAVSRVLDKRDMLDTSLAGAPGFAGMSTADRALSRAIAATSMRRLGQIRRLLDAILDKPLDETPKLARDALIIGAAQIAFMDVPDHAAVSTSVELVRAHRQGGRKRAGLVNAVLRRVTREARDRVASLSAADALPDWLRDRWKGQYGEDRLRSIAAVLLGEPPLDLTAAPGRDSEHWSEALDAVRLPTGGWRRARAGDVARLPGFEAGDWWAQDAAAALPATLLNPRAGERVADLCAAPGGKTLQLAAAGADVTAVDISKSRLRRLEENLERTGLRADIVAADLRAWSPGVVFDAILFDAPCSATGTLRRHPEAGWIKSQADIASLSAVQRALGDRAADLLKPGGRMVFCTCSMEAEEGEDWLAAFLERRPDMRIDPVGADELPELGEALLPDGSVRITPDMWAARGGIDGFFIARLVRRG